MLSVRLSAFYPFLKNMMNDSQLDFIWLSPLDEARFGVRTARASDITSERLPTVFEFCRVHNVRFLIVRCSTSELSSLHTMQEAGFLLMDTLSYFDFDLHRKALPLRRAMNIRTVQQQDIDTIKEIARQAFHGYGSHYHADPRLDRSACDELYVDWATRSCLQKDLADEVFVADSKDGILGFLAIKIDKAKSADCRLYAVSQQAQRNGVGQALLIEALYWCVANDLAVMTISTQVTNIASQKACIRVGFEPCFSSYTFHKWIDKGE